MSPDKKETRFHPRLRVEVPAAAFGTAPDLEEIGLRTIDLSIGGALCRSEVRFEVGLPVDLRLELSDEAGAPHPVVLQAMVVRIGVGDDLRRHRVEQRLCHWGLQRLIHGAPRMCKRRNSGPETIAGILIRVFM